MKFSSYFISATKEYCSLENWVNAPYFRREFEISEVKKAELTICGLGLYELFINGRRITRGYLSSYTANPDQILYYDHYDLTEYVVEGENV